MEKFTIADKQDAQHILENNPSLTQEDKDVLSRKPVFNVLSTLFRKYYDLELLSPYDAGKSIFILNSRTIDKYWPNIVESYVSMVPYNDYLVLPQEEEKVRTWSTDNAKKRTMTS
jgi:hypothetical protein